MRRIVSLILVLSLTLIPVLAGCVPQNQAIKKALESPYTFDYKTDKKNVKFFTEGDTYGTLKAASPFYAGAQPQPSGRGAEYAKLRAVKVAEIEKEAKTLAARAKAMAPKVARIRSAYLAFLTDAYKEEPKLKEYTKETFSRLSMARTKEAFVAAEYASLDSKTKNAFADSFVGYLQAGKAVELGSLYLEDIHNIVGFSAAAISSLADHPNPKIKDARAKLDKEMDAFDNLREDIKAVQGSMAMIDYGLRQLESSDYYLAKEGARFMAANMAGLKAKAKQLKPKPGLTKADIKFSRNYVKVMGKMRAQIAARLKKVDKKRLIPVEVKKRPAASLELVSPAYAADELPYVSGAADTLQLPMDQGEPRPSISPWDILKVPGKIWKAGKTTTGVILDVAGVAVTNITRAGYGIYNGEPAKSIWQDMQQNTKVITKNFNKGVSGSSTLKTAGEYLEGVETGAGKTAEAGVEATPFGKGWTSWGVGGFTKIVVGTFTGLGKGIYKVAKTDATTADVVGGSVDIGLSFIGGSKTIFNPGVLKTLGKEGVLTAKGGINFIKTMLVNADKAAAKKAMAKLLGNPNLTEAELAQLLAHTAEYQAKEAVAKTLMASRERLLKAMKNMLVAGGKKALTEGRKGLKEALEGLLEKSYAANLASIRELLGETVGKDIGSFIGNVVAGQVDGFISGLITEIMAGAPDPAELNGQWKGSMTITDVILPPGADPSKKPEGCDIDLSKLKGKTVPIDWTIQLGEDGNGTIGSGNGPPMAVNYSGGAISGSGSQKGATMTMSGEFTRGEESGYAGSGEMNISYGEGIKIIASWTVSK